MEQLFAGPVQARRVWGSFDFIGQKLITLANDY